MVERNEEDAGPDGQRERVAAEVDAGALRRPDVLPLAEERAPQVGPGLAQTASSRVKRFPNTIGTATASAAKA